MKKCLLCGGDFSTSDPPHLLAHGMCLKRTSDREDMIEAKEFSGITMSHDKLVLAIGLPNYEKIVNAGFVMVPKQWREQVLEERWKRNKEPSS